MNDKHLNWATHPMKPSNFHLTSIGCDCNTPNIDPEPYWSG